MSEMIDDKLVASLQAVVQDIESLLEAESTLASAGNKALEDARGLAGEAEDFARDNPWCALGAAAAAGLALGLFVGRS